MEANSYETTRPGDTAARWRHDDSRQVLRYGPHTRLLPAVQDASGTDTANAEAGTGSRQSPYG